jgi:hypothetical protein
VLGNTTVQGISAERLELTVEGGVPIPALLFRAQRQARPRIVVFASTFGKSNDADVAALVKHGTTVLAVDPRGIGESYSAGGRSGYRQAYQLGARAILLGRNLLEMQSSDLVAAVRYMESRPEAAGRKVSLYAKGGLGPAALMAGVLYPAIAELVIERSIVSYMDVAAAAVHEGMDQLIVPGILQSADLPDAMRLLAGRPLTLISPLQPNGKPLLAGDVQSRLGSTMPNVSVILRGEGWPADRAIPRWFE